MHIYYVNVCLYIFCIFVLTHLVTFNYKYRDNITKFWIFFQLLQVFSDDFAQFVKASLLICPLHYIFLVVICVGFHFPSKLSRETMDDTATKGCIHVQVISDIPDLVRLSQPPLSAGYPQFHQLLLIWTSVRSTGYCPVCWPEGGGSGQPAVAGWHRRYPLFR